MNNNQVDIVLQYLKIETNYAVVINGKYGIGKTFFYENSLKPEIEKLGTLKDASKTYIPIRISLFGIKNIEELKAQIFTEIYPILKNKKLQLATNVFKSFVNLFTQRNKDEYSKPIKEKASDRLSYDNLVICFDDFDRKSDIFSLRELSGYVNSLVENENTKIIIILNDKTLVPDEGYKELKDKIIGVNIDFIPEPNYVFHKIIKNKYSISDKIYYDFLKKTVTKLLIF